MAGTIALTILGIIFVVFVLGAILTAWGNTWHN